VSHEVSIASGSVIARSNADVQFLNSCPWLSYKGVHETGSSGETTCSSMAASAVTGFHVDPGAY
jgi:hypothetical protein